MTIKINGTNTTAQPSITGADTDTGLVYGTDQVQVVTGGTTRVTVDSSGNVTTTGNVDLGNVNTSSNSNTGSKLETSGQLLLQLSSSVGAGNQNGIAVYYGNTLKTTIKNDGSASFAAGAFAIASDGDITTNIRGHGHLELDSTGSFGSPKVKLFGNTGNAEFTGAVIGKAIGPAYAFEITNGTTNMGGLYRDSAGANLYLKNSSGTNNVSILSNGAATFASYNDSSTSGFGVNINVNANTKVPM